MGFRTTWISEHMDIDWPGWFRDKYEGRVNFHRGLISSKFETKGAIDVMEDVQKALVELEWDYLPFHLVMLHECGGIEKVSIYKDKILYGDPHKFIVHEFSMHSSCCGCHDLENPNREFRDPDNSPVPIEPLNYEAIEKLAKNNPEVDLNELREIDAKLTAES